MARPEGLEPPAYWFEASRSIRLSYGRSGYYYTGAPRLPGFRQSRSGRVSSGFQIFRCRPEALFDAVRGNFQGCCQLLNVLAGQMPLVDLNRERLTHWRTLLKDSQHPRKQRSRTVKTPSRSYPAAGNKLFFPHVSQNQTLCLARLRNFDILAS